MGFVLTLAVPLKALIYELYLAAETPTLDKIAAAIIDDDELAGAPRRDTTGRIIGDPGMPASQADVVAVVTALKEQRNGEWRYLEFLQVTSLITAGIFMREIPRWDESQASVPPS